MPVPTLSELIIQLQQGTLQERCQAAHLLSGYQDPQAVDALSLVLSTSPNLALLETVVKSLGRMGSGAFNSLLLALRHGRPEVRAIAAEALGKQHNLQAVDQLLAAARDLYPRVRKQVAGALIHYKDERTIETLKSLLQDPDPDVRSRAASVLQSMGITAPVNIPIVIQTGKLTKK
jgi:HEAT repeat protein